MNYYYTAPNPPGWVSWQSASTNPGRLSVTISNTSTPTFLYVPTI